jgi:hypothetical protein
MGKREFTCAFPRETLLVEGPQDIYTVSRTSQSVSVNYMRVYESGLHHIIARVAETLNNSHQNLNQLKVDKSR